MKALGIIPARGGSKGVPRKNLRLFDGTPLIAHSIKSGLGAKRLGRLIVSTDDEEIAQVSRHYGADVPFQRPPSLATDTASQIDVVLHALDSIERDANAHYDCVVLLQPTSPLRSSDDIDACVEKLESEKADSVISLCRVEYGHPYYMYTLDGGVPVPLIRGERAPRRQDFPEVYLRNGAIYVTRRETLLKQRSFYGHDIRPYVMPYDRSINIDTELDFALAEFFLSRTRSTS